MPRFLIKLDEDKYVQWSSVVDAPVTYIMTHDEAMTEFGEMRVLRARPRSKAEFNRAGPEESQISVEEIIEKYTYHVRIADPDDITIDAIEDEDNGDSGVHGAYADSRQLRQFAQGLRSIRSRLAKRQARPQDS